MAVSEKIVEKIKKLFALSNNNPSEEEAQAAMLQAQRLMMKHGVAAEDVSLLDEDVKREAVRVSVPFTTLKFYEKAIASIVADNFRCFWFYNQGSKKLTFLGLENDATTAREVYTFAVKNLKFHMEVYSKLWRQERQTFFVPYTTQQLNGVKNDFAFGYIDGLKEKFKEQVEKENWGLMLVKDDAVITAHKQMRFSKGAASSVRSSGDAQAYAEGKERGRAFARPSGYIE